MSHDSNRFPPTFDYPEEATDFLLLLIILKNVMDKDINLIRDDKEYDILENVFVWLTGADPINDIYINTFLSISS